MNAGDGNPEVGIDASGKDPGIDGRDAGGSAVDGDFAFTESGVGAAFEFIGNVVGDAGVPEFVVMLALGKDIEEDALDVGGEGESLFECGLAALSGGVKGDGAAGGSGGEGDDLIGSAGGPLALGEWVEEEVGGAVEYSGVSLVDFVAEIDGAVLSDCEDGTSR